MKTHRTKSLLLLVLAGAVVAGLGALGCSSDSPSEPQQQPGPPPGTTPPSGAFNITVLVNPSALAAGSDEPSTITIQVRRRDNNQPPVDGTTIVVTTTLGDLLTQDSGIQSVIATLVGGNAQLLLFAGDIQGTALIQARLEESFGQANVAIAGSATFFLSFVDPATGNPNGGETVEVVGGGIAEPVRVTFGGVVAQVLSVSSSRIRVVTPPSTTPVPVGTTRPVNVVVTIHLNEDDEATDTLASGFIYVPGGGGGPLQPVVFGVNPTSGPNEGGTRVVITGDGFEAPVQVFFGAGEGGGPFIEGVVESVSRTQIVCRTPAATGFGQANQNSTVDLRVRNVNSGFATTETAAFTYGSSVLITAVEPNRIVFDSQATITIRGQGFEAPLQVIFPGGLLGTVISVAGTQIVVRAPIPLISNCEDLFGPVQVVLTNNGDSDSTDVAPGPELPDFGFQVPQPVVTGVSPVSGTGAGGTPVAVTGSGFDEPVRVQFGGNSATVVSVNPAGTSISVLTPTFTDFDTAACDDNGDGQQGERFVATSVDVTVTNLGTGCDDTLEGGFTYTPTDASCRGDVAPTLPQCSDTIDNDGDTLIDFPADPQCSSATDNDEST